MKKKLSLSEIIERSSVDPAPVSGASRAYSRARATLDERKRKQVHQMDHERNKARVEERAKLPVANFLDHCFQRDGYAQSYSVPVKVSRSNENPRIYWCNPTKLLSMEKVNWMKAHGIEHLILVEEGELPLPAWWAKTEMTFRQFARFHQVYQYLKDLLESHPEHCVLIARME